jgi:hypothetical protein
LKRLPISNAGAAKNRSNPPATIHDQAKSNIPIRWSPGLVLDFAAFFSGMSCPLIS